MSAPAHGDDSLATVALSEAATQARLRGRWWTGAFTSLVHNKSALIAVSYLCLLAIAAVIGALLVSEDLRRPDLLARWEPPLTSWSHLLGTDALGRDMLAQLVSGARLTLTVGVGVVLVSGTVGTLVGLVAGYKGGWIEALLMRIADAQLAFPGLLLVLLVLAFVGTGVPVVIAVLAVFGWMVYARMVRGQVLQLRQTPAIQSAELVGCSTPRILFRHLLPNIYPLLLTQGMLEFARVILAEASLSYLGVGIQPPDTSWGLMVAENQAYISTAWWTIFLPGAALTCTVLALNLFSNWLAVQTDPQQRQRRFALTIGKQSRPPFTIVAPERNLARPAPLLSVKDLRVDFHTPEGRVTAVQDASLEIRHGETVGIVGESGSGKSTTALALMDLVPPPGRIEHATMSWQGEPISRRDLQRLRGSDITVIFQDPMTSLNPLVPVGRQVAESLVKHRSMTKAQARVRTEELFSLVGIPSPRQRLEQFPYELSGGMRQRVMIAIALAPEPKLVIADEPTTALDATIQAQILELIAELQQRLGVAMLLITHDLGVVARVCDRVIVMYGGRQVEQAPADRLFGDPRHRYTEALLEAAPSIDYGGRRLAVIPGSPPHGAVSHPGCPFIPRCRHAIDRCAQMPPTSNEGDARSFACWVPREPGLGPVRKRVGVRAAETQ